ncbi:hypothetical protein [Inquilinus sp. CAU 1745]|uniref:type IV toxin-antitoxin system AbiEi family antitoxin domain-containing protein n=1 Tax=Inquilinus sp. CAU 1745 TaxID=3140369 RepID=UPI00325B4C43
MLLADGSMWRMKDLLAEGIAAQTVRRAVAAGTVEALSRGVYRRAGAYDEHGAILAEVSARVPDGVICLFSAADFHEITDVTPRQIWVGIPNNRRPPKLDWPPIRAVRWRGAPSFDVGVEERVIHGVPVRMTTPARTVVDMLRMMKTVGEDRALECLRDYAANGGSAGEVRVIADRIGVGQRLRPYVSTIPYLEAGHAKQHRSDWRKS